MNELKIEFTGNSMERGVFMSQLTDSLVEFVGVDNSFIMFVREIVKNIYDHAEGKGLLIIKKEEVGENELFHFEIKDFGTESYDLAEIKKKGSSKFGNGINFGMGVCDGAIEEFEEVLKLKNFKINTSKGFCYTGTYPRTGQRAEHCARLKKEAPRS